MKKYFNGFLFVFLFSSYLTWQVSRAYRTHKDIIIIPLIVLCVFDFIMLLVWLHESKKD